jgi:hypothetical protein
VICHLAYGLRKSSSAQHQRKRLQLKALGGMETGHEALMAFPRFDDPMLLKVHLGSALSDVDRFHIYLIDPARTVSGQRKSDRKAMGRRLETAPRTRQAYGRAALIDALLSPTPRTTAR